VLVQVARVEGVPGVQLRDDPKVDEPVGLQGLPEVSGSVRRHMVTDLGDAEEFRPPSGIRLRLGHLPGLESVPAGEGDQCLGGDLHGPQLLLLGVGLRIVQEIQPFQGVPNVGDEVPETLSVDLVVQDRVPRGPLLHELGEDAGLVGRQPLRGHLTHDEVPERPPLPVGDDLLLVAPAGLWVHSKRDLRPGVQDIQVLRGVAADLRIGGRGFRR
jgi:hypothetical protein